MFILCELGLQGVDGTVQGLDVTGTVHRVDGALTVQGVDGTVGQCRGLMGQ